ncbi:hypothetical protein J3U21_03935 [Gilliamella sp. B2776]|uniref:BRO family protein n=1 Tax=unclassified Gilliamella TaxID=2685620 RepID=UPI002269D2F7|nr:MULTISPECIES: BRO family protein [unclassified Gilliamella]MCX8649714.1 hypothetical protein [Gilliamella sp. B2779]MCX8654073.1 hypothetical protein [Gilliamella sp. B2737]MCX8657280.1 hypothetical protein [Gilliamella sp. B2894]MCX8665100.1 hypothetical protein [Gilliamella sp. B2887]MCX8691296.1 hypothetical protein [Gilliamella sp. B2776]
MSNLSIFNFHQSQVRIQFLENQPIFCLKDIAGILNISNAKVSRFNISIKGVHKMYLPTNGGNQELLFINEPNLYRIIFRSNKKEAIEFQNWVLEEVLPTIRKTGSYSLTINAEQQQQIQQAINERVYRTGERLQAVYSKFHQQFKITSYLDLPSCKFDEAMKWLGGMHSRNALSDEDLYKLAWLYKAADKMRYQIELIEPALRLMDSKFRGAFYSMAVEYKRTLNDARTIIERETAHIKTKRIVDNWHKVLPIIRNN